MSSLLIDLLTDPKQVRAVQRQPKLPVLAFFPKLPVLAKLTPFFIQRQPKLTVLPKLAVLVQEPKTASFTFIQRQPKPDSLLDFTRHVTPHHFPQFLHHNHSSLQQYKPSSSFIPFSSYIPSSSLIPPPSSPFIVFFYCSSPYFISSSSSSSSSFFPLSSDFIPSS